MALRSTRNTAFTIRGCQKVRLRDEHTYLIMESVTKKCFRLDVDYAFQCLAIDERRLTFPPTLWHATTGAPAKDLQQCWFPGVHGNIGGGADDPTAPANDHGEIADITFAWMVRLLISLSAFR